MVEQERLRVQGADNQMSEVRDEVGRAHARVDELETHKSFLLKKFTEVTGKPMAVLLEMAHATTGAVPNLDALDPSETPQDAITETKEQPQVMLASPKSANLRTVA